MRRSARCQRDLRIAASRCKAFALALLFLALASALFVVRADVVYPPVRPDVPLEFPRDHGSHPDFKLEWWYVTGWLDDASASGAPSSPRGFQVTFFRVRTGVGEDNPSAFAPRQVLFAHAAVADPALGRLRYAQRSGRVGFGLVQAREGDIGVRLDDWSMQATQPGRYHATVRGDDFALDLQLDATQPPLLQGDQGFSRKGPDARAASYYYSLPHVSVTGSITLDGKPRSVRGEAWFDHEWSSDYVDQSAVGWDWLGVNLHDGGALMAFRMRGAGTGSRWAAATLRPGNQGKDAATSFAPQDVQWTPLDTWQSPRTGVRYPIRWRVTVGDRRYRAEPLLRDAELDSRGTTGILYWEGPIRLLDDVSGAEVGRGYLELTGYGGRVEL